MLVVGAEKMSGVSTKQSSRIIASMLNSEERKSGATLPAFAAFMAKRYIEKFGASRESLAMVAVKNHFNALSNPAAHHQKAVTLEAVLGSRIVADPLRLYEFCPISDGAAAILEAADKTAASFDHKRVRIASTNQAFSGSSVSTRDPFLTIDCVQKAANGAFQSAGLSPKDVDVAELHDMATILEIVESEDVGFFKKGDGWRAVMEADTGIGGAFPLNTSGGLNSRGHPIGATGIAQAGEIYLQLSGNAGGRQVKNASTGFSLNMSGFGNSASAITYEAI